jgi:glycosyltransferase involved in cell wall biosynthesis
VKILLLNQTFYPDPVATAQQLTDFAVDLVRAGHSVTVLAGRRGYAEPHPLYAAKEIYQGVKIIRVWPFTFGRKSKILRMVDFLFINLSFAWRLLWMPKADRVVAMTTPPLLGFVALLSARSRKCKFIYWMMDLNPDQGIELGWLKKGCIQARFLERALKFVLKHSDRIIVLDRFMKERILSKGADPEKITIIPPWSHDEDLEAIEHPTNPFRKKNGLDGKFIVMYSGNHSICHPLDTLLEAALLLKNDPAVVFTFIGGGERVEEVLQFKEKHRLSNMIYLPYLPRSEMKYSLSAADLHVVVMGDSFVGIVHPCKIYGILTLGRPFVYIGPSESPIRDLMAEPKIGYSIRHGEAEKFVEIIYEMRRLGEPVREETARKEKFIAQQYGRHRLSQELQRLVTAE